MKAKAICLKSTEKLLATGALVVAGVAFGFFPRQPFYRPKLARRKSL